MRSLDNSYMASLLVISCTLFAPSSVLAQADPLVLERLNSDDVSQVIEQLSLLRLNPVDEPDVVRKLIQLLDDGRYLEQNSFVYDSVQLDSYIALTIGPRAIRIIVEELPKLKTPQGLNYLLQAIRSSQDESEALYRAILPFLKHPDEGVRGNAIQALSKVATKDDELSKNFDLMLSDPSDFVRASTVLAMQVRPIAAGMIVEKIAPLLSGTKMYYVAISDHATTQRRLAAEVAKLLGLIGNPAKPWKAELLEAMRRHNDGNVRLWSAVASIQLSEENLPEAYQTIAEFLKGDPLKRSDVRDTLEGVIALGEKALPLLEQLRVQAKDIRFHKNSGSSLLADAFYAISPDAAVDDVLLLVGSDNEWVCEAAISALIKHNERSERVIAAYISVLQREDDLGLVRSEALMALGKLGPAAAIAEPAIQELLKKNHLSEYDRELIQKALTSLKQPIR
jgi:HEAT repeat protein